MVRSFCLLSLVLCCASAFADVTSGPEVGKPVEGFQVETVVGDSAGQTVDPVAARGTEGEQRCQEPITKGNKGVRNQ